LTQKKENDHDVVLCPRCSLVFDETMTKAFNLSQAQAKPTPTTKL